MTALDWERRQVTRYKHRLKARGFIDVDPVDGVQALRPYRKDEDSDPIDAMGKSKVATEFGTMRVQNNPHSYPHELWQRDKMPKKYFDVVPEHLELNIDRVKDDLKANVEVPGAWRTQTRGLRIQ